MSESYQDLIKKRAAELWKASGIKDGSSMEHVTEKLKEEFSTTSEEAEALLLLVIAEAIALAEIPPKGSTLNTRQLEKLKYYIGLMATDTTLTVRNIVKIASTSVLFKGLARFEFMRQEIILEEIIQLLPAGKPDDNNEYID